MERRRIEGVTRDALKERSHFTIFDDLSEYYVDATGIYTENDRITLKKGE